VANWVNNTIQDVLFRVGKLDDVNFHPAAVLRAMNRLYQRLNRKYLCLEKNITLDSESDYYVEDGVWGLPADWVKPFWIEPEVDFKDPDLFDPDADESGTSTIVNGQLRMANVDDTASYEVWYFSTGLELVDKDSDLAAAEINQPEWTQESLHQILLYGTCLDLSPDYPLRNQDLFNFEELRSELASLLYNKQDITPQIAGGFGKQTERQDAYEQGIS
jgi:hypothetical protein